MTLDREFWDQRWQEGQTGWDIGNIAPAMREYIDGHISPTSSILIPGCGSAHEAAYMLNRGYSDIHLLDISPTACSRLQKEFEGQPVTVHCYDFFEHQGSYDHVMEQTFFCAIDPSLRERYVEHVATLLEDGGSVFGLLFDVDFEKKGPPFGGSRTDYIPLFQKYFEEVNIEATDKSIEPRQGTEVFLEAKRPIRS